MFRRVLALLALPMAGLLAQGRDVQVRITAANGAAYRIFNVAGAVVSGDTDGVMKRPIIARGEFQLRYRTVEGGALTVAAVDSVSRIHIEASENGQLIATAEGPYVAVLRDSTGHVMVEARSSIPREPVSFPRRPSEGAYYSR
jgi:hypothetical protein